MMKRADSQLLVIFGASGDLTGRKLLPALFELFIGDMLPEHFAILGAARTGYTDEEFRAEQRKHILDRSFRGEVGIVDRFVHGRGKGK